MTRALLASALALLAAGPALAQTDDRITNDALRILGAIMQVDAIVEHCEAADGLDPAVADTLEAWMERNGAWRTTAISLIGNRGAGVDEPLMEKVHNEFTAAVTTAFFNAPDPAATCASIAAGFAGDGSDLSATMAAETTRVSEAMQGKWAVLDVANSTPVAMAESMLEIAERHTVMLERCYDELGQPLADAHAAWVLENFDVIRAAEQILENWGAVAYGRKDARRALAQFHADEYIGLFGRIACEAYLPGGSAMKSLLEEFAPQASFVLGQVDFVPAS